MIVVNTFRRDICLRWVLEHWRRCRPRQLRVVWNDVWRPPPLSDWHGMDVFVDMPTTSNLTNRFLPQDFGVEAVFSVDDDVVYSCAELWAAYRSWQEHPAQLVGFAPTFIFRELGRLGSYSNAHVRSSKEANTLFITRGGFVHRRYYDIFSRSEYAEFRGMVDAHVQGEDLLMSLVHAAVAESPELAKPVPILSQTCAELSCHTIDAKAAKPLRMRTVQRLEPRKALVRQFVSRFGFPFQTADISAFRYVNLTSSTASLCSQSMQCLRRKLFVCPIFARI